MDDNLYPNSSEFMPLAEPKEQTIARKREEANTLAAKPMLAKIIKHFNDRIEFYGQIDSVPQDARKDDALFRHIIESNDLTRQNLMNEKEWIEGLLGEYAAEEE